MMDGDDLQGHNDIDDAMAGAEPLMRLPEPCAQHAIFGNAVQAPRSNLQMAVFTAPARINVPTTTTKPWKYQAGE